MKYELHSLSPRASAIDHLEPSSVGTISPIHRTGNPSRSYFVSGEKLRA